MFCVFFCGAHPCLARLLFLALFGVLFSCRARVGPALLPKVGVATPDISLTDDLFALSIGFCQPRTKKKM